MSPADRYRQLLDSNTISPDSSQQQAVAQLQLLYEQLQAYFVQIDRNRGGFLSFLRAKPATPRGLYLWGGVGRGKTFLMDMFYECLPAGKKRRTHFHRFMQRVHKDLAELKGEKNPLEKVAEGIAGEARILCFDEFFVSDIGDAMLLAGLLTSLFERNVVLLATSNIAPGGLYENGLQRDRFLPAIGLIQQHCNVMEIASGVDYRLRSLSSAPLYYTPLDDCSDASLARSFAELAPDTDDTSTFNAESVEILGRFIEVRQCCDDVIWFDFHELCGGPRSASDYVEIAKLYHAVLIGGIPELGEKEEDLARRFVNLIDELYDRNVKLVIAAEKPIETLYSGRKLAFEFQRTQSRLIEMQSHEYLAKEHRSF